MNKPKWATKTIEGRKGVSAIPKGNQYVAVHSERIMGSDGKRQTIKTDLGIIVPGELVVPNIAIPIKDIQIFEYGMSKAIFDLCPLEWKNHVSTLSPYGWLDVLGAIIGYESPDSYLLWRFKPHKEKGRYYGAFRRRLESLLPIKINELKEKFGPVVVVVANGETTLSRMSAGTKQEAERLGVNLEELI